MENCEDFSALAITKDNERMVLNQCQVLKLEIGTPNMTPDCSGLG